MAEPMICISCCRYPRTIKWRKGICMGPVGTSDHHRYPIITDLKLVGGEPLTSIRLNGSDVWFNHQGVIRLTGPVIWDNTMAGMLDAAHFHDSCHCCQGLASRHTPRNLERPREQDCVELALAGHEGAQRWLWLRRHWHPSIGQLSRYVRVL